MNNIKELNLYKNSIEKKINEKLKILEKYTKDMIDIEYSIEQLKNIIDNKSIDRTICELLNKKSEIDLKYKKELLLYNGFLKKYNDVILKINELEDSKGRINI